MNDEDLSPEENRAIAARIKEELARKRLTRQHLADLAKISLSTVEKALAGQRPFTLASLVRVEEALKVKLRKEKAAPSPEGELAPQSLGSYSRPAVAWLEGDYLTLRPSFSDPNSVYAYLTEIRWDHALSHLAFRESERIDAAFKQDGAVSVPHQSGYIYLVTNKHGQYRLVIVSRPTIRGELHGILTTLQVGRGAQLTPVATPIVLAPLKTIESPEFGLIKPGRPCYASYRRLLKRTVEEPFALFLTGA
ncbi:MAG: helix-turn-helix transcriptional regulator [Rhizobiales bacterium]|nr:helix-turn-helix transcriptional regulator [Hyphomicrobiales bacterium]